MSTASQLSMVRMLLWWLRLLKCVEECCASVNNAPWISTPIEQKNDLSFQWALHIYSIFDQKLLSFEIQLLQVFCFLWLPESKIGCASSKTEFQKGGNLSSLTVYVSAVLWLHKSNIETKTLISGIFPPWEKAVWIIIDASDNVFGHGVLTQWQLSSLRRVRLQNCCLTVVAVVLHLVAGGCHPAGQLGLFGLQGLGTTAEAVGAEFCVCSLAWDGARGAGVCQPHWAGWV